MKDLPVDVALTSAVANAIDNLGRTEDVCFSPSGNRLAIAGFGMNVVYVVDLEIEQRRSEATALSVVVNGLTTLRCASLHEPHGVTFLTDDTIAVANRHAEVPILAVPAQAVGLRTVEVVPLQTLRADEIDGLKSPGSVVATELAPELFELLVCNNYADNVSRHIVDARDGFRVLSSEVLIRHGLEIPDGATVSADRGWIAVSNHNTHSVWLYRFTEALCPESPPDGVLENVHYPHGLRFAADDGVLIVADAGAPYLTAFARGTADWTGVRQPTTTIRVMEDDAFLRGRYNLQEGGPKGLAIHPTGQLLAVTSEHQPLHFIDSRELIGDGGPSAATVETASRSEATRVALLRSMCAASRHADDAGELERAVAERDSAVSDLGDEIQRLRDQVAELEAVAAASARDQVSHDSAMEDLRVQVGLLNSAAVEACAQQDARAQRCAAELADARESLAYERHVVSDRDAQLDAIRSSTSWRLTAPLRALIGLGRSAR